MNFIEFIIILLQVGTTEILQTYTKGKEVSRQVYEPDY